MNIDLKRTVLDWRQFTGVLLVAFSLSSLVIAVVVNAHPPTGSPEGIIAGWQAEASTVETFGFLMPPLQSLFVPLLTVTALLAAVNCWLSVKKKQETV